MGKQPERMSGVPTVRHPGERLRHTPQVLGHLTTLRRVQKWLVRREGPRGTSRWRAWLLVIVDAGV